MHCTTPGCAAPRYRTSNNCYEHWLARPRCATDGCDRLVHRRSRQGRCYVHHEVSQGTPVAACSFDACDRTAVSRGLCGPHAKQRGRGQELRPLKDKVYQALCSFDGCERPNCARGLCATHYNQKRLGRELTPIPLDGRAAQRPRPRCTFAGCDRWARGHSGERNSLCSGHYDQLRRGVPLRPLFSPRSPDGVSTGHVNAGGYRVVYVSGVATLEHRLVMERLIGRPLAPYENVHHINGDKLDNRPENLELWVNKQPRGQRVSDLIQFVVDHYLPQVLERVEQGRRS